MQGATASCFRGLGHIKYLKECACDWNLGSLVRRLVSYRLSRVTTVVSYRYYLEAQTSAAIEQGLSACQVNAGEMGAT